MFDKYPEILKISDITEYLGVSDAWIIKEITMGNLKAYKLGKRYLVEKKDMLEYMDDRRVKR